MKFMILFVSTFVLITCPPTNAATGTVSVTVTNVNTEKGGVVKLGVFDSNGFPTVGKEVAGENLEATQMTLTEVFHKIPTGTYAISVFQDHNSNGQLDKNLFGAPTEPYGFSTNQYGMFGPPDFIDVSFEVRESTPTSLTINME